MVALSLKISIGNVVKTMQFEPSTMVYDACRMIRERIPEALAGPPNDFGLFLSDDDPKKRHLARGWESFGLLHAPKWGHHGVQKKAETPEDPDVRRNGEDYHGG